MRMILTITLLVFLISCSTKKENDMNITAEKFVKLVLKVGQYDPAVVDAYSGPDEWKPAQLLESEKGNYPKEELKSEVKKLQESLMNIDESQLSDLGKMRKNYLLKQLTALNAKIEIIGGKKYSFDEESKLLYDAVAPHHGEEYFTNVLLKLDEMLPGDGDVAGRFENYRNQFIIPPDKLDTVFQTAINEGRKRTLQYIQLPEDENFVVEYVRDKSWGAYNWYKGNSFSVIQVNTDLPVYIDRAIDLACHEGYPGHHVYNLLLENKLLKGRNWVEFYVYPLFSPTSLIAEGTANYGIDVAFPGEERLKYEKEILFPLAGLDPQNADKYYQVLDLVSQIKYSRNEAGRKYFDGEFSREETKDWLVKYSLYTPVRAEKFIDFIDEYGSYIINYNYGLELCTNYIERKVGTIEDPSKRWEIFTDLISKPYTPSDLK